MDAPAMARERLAALRRTIARIEGRPAQTLDGTAGSAAGPGPLKYQVQFGNSSGRVENDAPREPERSVLGVPASPLGLKGGADKPPASSLPLKGGAKNHVSTGSAEERYFQPGLIRTGITAFDAALGGGLQAAALTELRTDETRHAAALLGFAICLAATMRSDMNIPILWLGTDAAGRETGLPYLPGVCGLAGIAPGSLFTALPSTLHDTLWVAEEAAASGAFCAIILEVRGNPKALGLDETRRLQRRAVLSGKPLFLLRVAGMSEPTAAPCRLNIAPAPSVPRRTRDGPLEGSIGAPAFRVAIEKARAPSHPPFVLEWNPNELLFTGRQADSVTGTAASANRPDRPAALGRELARGRTA